MSVWEEKKSQLRSSRGLNLDNYHDLGLGLLDSLSVVDDLSLNINTGVRGWHSLSVVCVNGMMN